MQPIKYSISKKNLPFSTKNVVTWGQFYLKKALPVEMKEVENSLKRMRERNEV